MTTLAIPSLPATRRALLLAAGAQALGAGSAFAQASGGTRPLRWIVSYSEGGGADFMARTIAQTWTAQTRQAIDVDNKTGDSSMVAVRETLRALPDGRTVLSGDNAGLVLSPLLFKTAGYNPARDLAPVTLMGRIPLVLVVGRNSPYKTLQDLLTALKSGEGKHSYGSAGAASPHRLAMELLKAEAGVPFLHVPYRGAQPASKDVAAGLITAVITDLASGKIFIDKGEVRPLAVASEKRVPQLPNVPTFVELGLPRMLATAHIGMVVPSATPAPIIDTLHRQVTAAINDPATHKRLFDYGIEPVANTPAQYAAFLREDTARWQKLIRDQHITAD